MVGGSTESSTVLLPQSNPSHTLLVSTSFAPRLIRFQLCPLQHIAPKSATNGCPNCHTHFCFCCLGMQPKEGGSTPKLLMPNGKECVYHMSKFCSKEEVEKHLDYSSGWPKDSRCGCSICGDCRKGKPCMTGSGSCNGNCVVCLGIVPHGKMQFEGLSVQDQLTVLAQGIVTFAEKATHGGDGISSDMAEDVIAEMAAFTDIIQAPGREVEECKASVESVERATSLVSALCDKVAPWFMCNPLHRSVPGGGAKESKEEGAVKEEKISSQDDDAAVASGGLKQSLSFISLVMRVLRSTAREVDADGSNIGAKAGGAAGGALPAIDCPACTFHNEAGARRCVVCETEFDVVAIVAAMRAAEADADPAVPVEVADGEVGAAGDAGEGVHLQQTAENGGEQEAPPVDEEEETEAVAVLTSLAYEHVAPMWLTSIDESLGNSLENGRIWFEWLTGAVADGTCAKESICDIFHQLALPYVDEIQVTKVRATHTHTHTQ